MNSVSLLIYIFYFHVDFIDTHIFTSISKLQRLAQVEKEMLKSLEIYIQDSENSGNVISENVQNFYKEVSQASTLTVQEHFMENPINAFHFIRRMHDGWPNMIRTIDCDHCKLTDPLRDFRDRLSDIDDNSLIGIETTAEDLQWAALANVRLWQTYKLNLTSFFNGQILNTTTNPLTWDDIFYICNQLDYTNEFYKEIVWLEEVLTLIINNVSYNKYRTRVTRQLASAYFKYGMPWKSVDLMEKEIRQANLDDQKKLKRDLAFYNSKEKVVSDKSKELKPSTSDIDKSHYEALCRGHVTRSTEILSRLHCIYRTPVPIYRVKEEILNYDPRISLFREVITHEEIDGIKDIATNMLKASIIVGDTERRNRKDYSARVSQTAWLRDEYSELVRHISYRIELITGLSTRQYRSFSHAEYLQVLNYGVGGMYEGHLDYLGIPIHINPLRHEDPTELRGTGDRISTWMFYLNDVTAGGATVFLNLNITVNVEKGAALFWYNIKRNGDLDNRTQHAGCPVLIGSKWVANKWIRQHGQIFRRKCGMKLNSKDIPL
ncbi:prolyl 4-hydroxylase subunit alpha-3-like [Ruditapes philippinarum]|uniref:prolyl 4-hydroxylase subunit alpha-3-like n=1 Tax=Ruditapes philippinarum TaxID=129788 RepID=UPI00295B2A9F|nr:prolyl 4-hydroxylase subunit alpha-3-like [Ruditapes philippinarum]